MPGFFYGIVGVMKEKNAPPAPDFRAIVVLLATQCMIKLGEVEDPFMHNKAVDLDGAHLFLSLLEVMQEKTKGNLTDEEESYLAFIIDNICKVYQKKSGN